MIDLVIDDLYCIREGIYTGEQSQRACQRSMDALVLLLPEPYRTQVREVTSYRLNKFEGDGHPSRGQ